MKVEVDQSIKIEQVGPTVLAFSNGISDAVVIPSSVKNECIEYLYSQGYTRQKAPLILFAAGVYILLELYIKKLQKVIIDVEYDGKDAEVKASLLRFMWKYYPNLNADIIAFKHIGKKSLADLKARNVREKKDKHYRKISAKQLIKIMT